MTKGTSLVIDDDLMGEALDLTGYKTKKAVVEKGLRLLVTIKRQEKIRLLRGSMQWQGDLEQMRLDK